MLASILGGAAGKVPLGSDGCRRARGALQTSPSGRAVPCSAWSTSLLCSPLQRRAAALSASCCLGSLV